MYGDMADDVTIQEDGVVYDTDDKDTSVCDTDDEGTWMTVKFKKRRLRTRIAKDDDDDDF